MGNWFHIRLLTHLGIKASISDIARIYDRGERSGTGIRIFERGGFVVDACKKANMLPETMFNSKFPSKWKIILINDNQLKGASGDKEVKFFNKNIERDIDFLFVGSVGEAKGLKELREREFYQKPSAAKREKRKQRMIKIKSLKLND